MRVTAMRESGKGFWVEDKVAGTLMNTPALRNVLAFPAQQNQVVESSAKKKQPHRKGPAHISD